MNPFRLLSENVQRKIWEMKWDSFTPVQNKTIPAVMETKKDIIISSATASGKTEAAFLPIISTVEKAAVNTLKVMYISPLKALINSQFERISDLCVDMDIPIHRWHGDISASKKKRFMNQPSGILQITPESIESLFINRTNFLDSIFKDIDFIIIDEIHSFIGTDRGVHLRSLMDRLLDFTIGKPRLIGLSATLTNFEEVKKWLSLDPDTVEVIESTGYSKRLLYNLMFFSNDENPKLPMGLYEDIRELTRERKAIIFVNHRTGVEEFTYILNRLSLREGNGECYYPHHSSIDKKLREYVERQMMEARSPKSVISTSTLELGIDIGDIDLVIQVDNTFTVSSLKQRLGRSGRKKMSDQILQLYTTKNDSLLQSIAVMELNLEGWVEPSVSYKVPYDIAFQQIISICSAANGISLTKLVAKISRIIVFKNLRKDLLESMIKDMITNDILEELSDREEIIVGLAGEKILRNKDFYAIFESTEMFTVHNKHEKIGSLDKNTSVQPGNNIILAGKLWTIEEVNHDKNKVYVTKAMNGNPPVYSSGSQKIHPQIHKKMLYILLAENQLEYVSSSGMNELNDMRKNYHDISLTTKDRPAWVEKRETLLETFAGTVIAQTLYWMIKAVELEVSSPDSLGRIKITNTPHLAASLEQLYHRNWIIDDIMEVVLPEEWFHSKYTSYLQEEVIYEMHVFHEIDLNGAMQFLEETTIKLIHLENGSFSTIGRLKK